MTFKLVRLGFRWEEVENCFLFGKAQNAPFSLFIAKLEFAADLNSCSFMYHEKQTNIIVC